MSVDGIINEQSVNFIGKDGVFWWIGEVEDNEDPMNVGRVKCRVLNYYTDPRGKSATSLPTEDLPWATVLQHTSQAGNDGQGESSGQLQPGSIVLGFFLDGENAQMPLVLGVLRMKKGDKSTEKRFLLSGEKVPEGTQPNPATVPVGQSNTVSTKNREKVDNNSVTIPNIGKEPGGPSAPQNIGTSKGINGSTTNAQKPRQTLTPAASGTGGPWKTLEVKLTYLLEDIANTAGNLVKSDSGDLIDVIENKVVTLDSLLAKVKNFLSAVFAQIVSAMRQQLDLLVQQIEKSSFITSFLGIPGGTFAVIQSAISAILSLICGIDQEIINFINAPIATLTNIVEGVINGLISKAEAVVKGAQSVVEDIICRVQGILDNIMDVINTVKSIVSGVQGIQTIIETWQKGSEIFDKGFDLVKLGISDLVGLLTLFLSLFDFGCDRKATGGEDDIGWYPFFGTTSCSAIALGDIGNVYGSCGGDGGSSFIDSFFDEADSYLTSAKNFLSGAYEMHMGTPGRQATVKKSASGKTETSLKGNNADLAEYKATAQARKEGKDPNDPEVKKEIDKYKKEQSGSQSDQGNFVSDHTSYPGNHTQEVHGDDCKNVDGDYCRTIDGDYRLKVTGDCHIEVGGGFFLNAQGGPKQVDNEGKEKKDKDKVQKHTMSFGSDLDLIINGAGLKTNCTNMEVGARDLKLSGSSYENSFKTSTFSPGEFVINAGNAITMNTTTLTQNINFLAPLGIASGYFCNVGGPINFLQIPAVSGGLPPYSVTTPGPFLVQCAAGGASFTVGAGAFNVKVAAGAISMSASAAASIEAIGAVTIKAGPLMQLSAIMIKLN